MAGIGCAERVGGEMAVEDEDGPIGTQGAQMIVSAAGAEPEFKHRSEQVAYQCGGPVEAEALGPQPRDEAIEAAAPPSREMACGNRHRR